MGALNLTWIPDRIFDLDEFDNERLIKAFDVIKNNIESGWLIPVDEKGNPVKRKITASAYVSKKASVAEEAMSVIEYEQTKDKKDFDPDELNTVGNTVILGGKYMLRPFLLMHHTRVIQQLKNHAWTMEDIPELELIKRHEHLSSVKAVITKIIWELKHGKRKN